MSSWIEERDSGSWRVRYRRNDRSKGSVGGFGTEQAAQQYHEELECGRRQGVWAEPAGAKTTLAEWVRRWWTTLNLDVRTLQNYERSLRLHILPRFGHRSMRAIAASDIAKWKLDCAESGYAHSTISGWVNLLSMILTDAADEGLIEVNPVRKLRWRGKRVWSARPERIWATPRQVRRVADQAGELGGPIARLLIIAAAWTGCRWGELAALHRRNVDLELGVIKIDREVGALHEATGKRWVGPPKTPSSARTIPLPPFLIALLREHLASHPYEYVFTTPSGCWLWRSTFDSRVLRPAADGNQHRRRRSVRTIPVVPGLTFHGLRHSHKTWMITNSDPEIAQARRLGHHLDLRLVEIYSHVSPDVGQRLLDGLEKCWRTAFVKGTHKSTQRHVPSRRRGMAGQGAPRRHPVVANPRTSPAGRRPEAPRILDPVTGGVTAVGATGPDGPGQPRVAPPRESARPSLGHGGSAPAESSDTSPTTPSGPGPEIQH